MNRSLLAFAAVGLVACSTGERRFPLRDPLTRDTDLASVWVRCRNMHSKDKGKRDHVTCAPEPYVSSLYWDGADNLIFRPLSDVLSVRTSAESINVNSVDEIPDSAWFTNRIATVTPDELRRGSCKSEQLLDPANAADASWVIDKGKLDGSTPGFRVVVPGKGKYMFKVESIDDQPERQSAAAVIGAAAYWAAGYYSACEQIVYVRPSVFRLTPGLRSRANFEPEKPFDQARLDKLLSTSPRRNGLLRMSASAWIEGYGIGPYAYEGTRKDDPNDIIPHEDRRELRGMRLLAAWLGRTDTREANSYDTWMADDRSKPESSPGKVLHFQLDESETLGGNWPWAPTEIKKRLGTSYLIDWGDIARDLVTLGVTVRPWEDLEPVPGHELFGYYQLESFDPEGWKNEYPNLAFSRMTERDAAWMARILARFTPELVHTFAVMGDFTDPSQTVYLEHVMEGRLERILERYLTRLSPIAELRVDGDRLCGVDLAELRGMRDASRFHYGARTLEGAPLPVTRSPHGGVCVALRHGGEPYVRVVIDDGVAPGKLVAHVYDLGDRFKLVGLERPSP
jgi:hypothetical protein